MTVSAPVFEIQRFSLHDGPGIRTLVFLKGCALHCPWCQNPESQDHGPVIAFYGERCVERFDCRTVCPEDAIRSEGFRVDQAKCTACGLCVEACAAGALRLLGETHTPEQLMQKIRADLPYYETSGGGVTFTGGEPTLHPRFLEQVVAMCASESIHTNLETAGVFSLDRWAATLGRLDLIYFDLKIMDADQHERELGSHFETIRKNARALVERGLPVEFRMPVIPDYTDTPRNIERVADFLDELGKPGLHLLAYHNMGEAKIDLISGAQPRLGKARLSDGRLVEVQDEFRRRGLEILNP